MALQMLSSPPADAGSAILDLRDELGYSSNYPAGVSGVPYVAGPSSAGFNSLSGSGAFIENPNNRRMQWRLIAALNNPAYIGSSWLRVPMNGLADAVDPLPANAEQYEYRHSVWCQRDANDAGVPVVLGAGESPAGGLDFNANAVGIEVYSEDATNGGNWTPRYRSLAGGAIVNGPDSGVSPTAGPALLEFRYFTGPVPRVQFYVNNIRLLEILGVLVPTPQAGSTTVFRPYIRAGLNAGGGATTARFERARHIIQVA